MKKILTFLRNPYHVGILVILLLAAYLRLYRISDYMTFLGDEGRDVLIVREILHGHLTFLGPRASAGDFFTGPIYYYMMAPFLFLFNYDPVGPAVLIALLSVATVFLIYYFGSKWFDRATGLIAATLYSVSPVVINYSHSSWNPNPMPFFSLVILYSLYKAIKKYSWKLYLGIGVLYGIAFQLHYIEVFFGVIIFLFVLLGSRLVEKEFQFFLLLKKYVLLFIGFLLGLSPFLAFEFKHDFQNVRAIWKFITTPSPNDPTLLHNPFFVTVWNAFLQCYGRLVTRFPSPDQLSMYSQSDVFWWTVGTFLLALAGIISLIWVKNKLAALMMFLWIFFGILLFGFYKKPIYDYYFEFLFPAPFLLTGNFLSLLMKTKTKGLKYLGATLGVIGFLFFTFINFSGQPFQYTPNRQKNQMKTISEFVLSKTGGKPYNFALITPGNSDHAYRYFFEIEGKPPVQIDNTLNDPKRKTVTDQLLIVCEDISCHPLGVSLFDVAGFGRAEIAGEWDVSVVKVFRLVHYTGK